MNEILIGIPPDIGPEAAGNTSLEECEYDIKNALTVLI